MNDSPEATEGAATPDEVPGAGADALAEALRAEHSAVYGYEFIGGAAEEEGRRDRASDLADEHKALRDTLHTAAVERGFDPPPARASYPLPEDRDDEAIDAFAVELEETTANAYLWLTASDDTELRLTAARNLQDTTIRALEWGGDLDVLPGFDSA